MANHADLRSLSQEERENLEGLSNTTQCDSVKKRIQAIFYKADGVSNKEIAEKLNVGEHAVGRWVKQFNNTGITGITGTSGRSKTEMSAAPCDDTSLDVTDAIFKCTDIGTSDFNESKNNTAKLTITINATYEINGKPYTAVITKTIDNINPTNYNSVAEFEASQADFNQTVRNNFTDACNSIIEGVSLTSCLEQQNNPSSIALVPFEDFGGSYQLYVPQEFKNQNGHSRIYYNRDLVSLYELAVSISTYRKGTLLINMALQRTGKNEIHFVTVHGFVCQEGKNLDIFFEKFKQEALEEFGFNPETGELVDPSKLPEGVSNPYINFREEMYDYSLEAIQNYNDEAESKDQMIDYGVLQTEDLTHPDDTVCVGVDEVQVKSQEKDTQVNNSDKAKSTL